MYFRAVWWTRMRRSDDWLTLEDYFLEDWIALSFLGSPAKRRPRPCAPEGVLNLVDNAADAWSAASPADKTRVEDDLMQRIKAWRSQDGKAFFLGYTREDGQRMHAKAMLNSKVRQRQGRAKRSKKRKSASSSELDPEQVGFLQQPAAGAGPGSSAFACCTIC